MRVTSNKILLTAAFGVLAMLAWGWASGRDVVALYSLLGRPERTAFTYYGLVLGPSFVYGVLAGTVLALFFKRSALFLLPVFWTALFVTSVLGACCTQLFEAARDFVLGTVTWVFLIGSALVPALVRLHRARS